MRNLDDIDKQVQPASIDLRLATEIHRFREKNCGKIRPYETDPRQFGERVDASEGEEVELEPGEFVLSTTEESVTLPDDLCGLLFGRSGLGRLGIAPHVGAGFVNPGWQGKLALEIVNHGPHTVVLRAGRTRIIQLLLFELETAARVPYGERQNSTYQP